MDFFIMPGDFRQALGNYLGGKPWGEVNPLMQGLMQLSKLDPPAAAPAVDLPIVDASPSSSEPA